MSTRVSSDPTAADWRPADATVQSASSTRPPGAEPPPQRRSLVHAVAWTAGAKWTGQLLTSGITLLVARILTPGDYGLMGMAVLFLGFVRFLSDFGIGGAIVARGEDDEGRLTSLNSWAVLLGLAGAVATLLAAVPLGQFFRQEKLPALMMVMSTTFVISGFRVIPAAVLQRDLRFKLLAGIDLVQALTAGLTTLGLALLGARYWALVLGNVLALALASGITVLYSPHRFTTPNLGKVRPAVTLSRDLTIANVCWYAYSNADFLIVGKVLGQTALGLYNIGWTLAMLIVERVTTIVGGVAPAYLSAARHDLAALRRYLLRISGSISLLTFPISLGLALVADDFCAVVLGPKWSNAIGSLRLLAMYAGLRSLTPIVPQILIVEGENRFVAGNAILAAVVMPAAFWIGARWGVEGVAMAWVLAFPIIAVPQFVRVFAVLQLTAREYVRGIRLPLVSSLIMAAAVAAFRLAAGELVPAMRLAIAVPLGACVYCASLYFVFGARPGTLVAMIRPRAAAS